MQDQKRHHYPLFFLQITNKSRTTDKLFGEGKFIFGQTKIWYTLSSFFIEAKGFEHEFIYCPSLHSTMIKWPTSVSTRITWVLLCCSVCLDVVFLTVISSQDWVITSVKSIPDVDSQLWSLRTEKEFLSVLVWGGSLILMSI